MLQSAAFLNLSEVDTKTWGGSTYFPPIGILLTFFLQTQLENPNKEQ